MTWQVNRRAFLQVSAAGAAHLLIGPNARALDLNSRLRLAAVGTGNKGQDDLLNVAASPRVEVVALCDVDQSQSHFGWAAEKYSRAARYADFRRLLDEAATFDAVTVSTTDHMHAPIAVAAMQLGKHVFCQKPLTHTVNEARRMREVAKQNRIVTQMGNQIQSHPAYRTAVKLVHDGAIGKVRAVHSWQSGGMDWLPKNSHPTDSDPIPKTLDWDSWLGVAPERPYKSNLYHPKNWRGWQDFGAGQLGDFGCHILDPVFMALELTAPTTIEAEAPAIDDQIWSPKSTVSYEFPGTPRTAGEVLPVTWYDGAGHKPNREGLGVPDEYDLPHAGSVLVGEQGTMVIPHWSMPQLFPEDKFREYKMPEVGEVNHYTSWADACLGDGKTTSHFGYAGPLAEAVLLGVIAIRFPKEQLQWDTRRGEFTHHADATARLTKEYRRGWPNPVG
ncbi:MAG: Gfo/Idh/MocA family oxidoreductase [Planctomycetes bacterium]|nr:Gfo/Idh/MocA family oxidoreductase [Planctomycetota bacterium]